MSAYYVCALTSYKFVRENSRYVHTSPSENYALLDGAIVEANKRINIFKVEIHRGSFHFSIHPLFRGAVYTPRPGNEQNFSRRHYRGETIPPLSLNYFRALAGTCVRYGVMDDALRNPPAAVSRPLRPALSLAAPSAAPYPCVTLPPRGMPLE